ncbi:uncharacterized protein LOC106156463 [Lingula anatina]|uniref:Uncharacterized protein LOC106156463 n=1 Tax=Lingula anatina TaxID=7574 RepID=A0A1S3HM66_LINAN|nr:uncharacterized protein LOC106156463 [Lingula anatina]|eukprot:XP_013387175.1 uncharacterized protein LOC106156463 [Lingula anatina]
MVVDNQSYARLAHLVLDLGAVALRHFFSASILQNGETLEQFLTRNKQNIWDCYKRKKVIHKSQYELLFLPNILHTPKLDDLDVTLLCFLIRQFHPNVPVTWYGWSCPDKAKAKADPLMTPEIEAIINIKYHRNQLAHRGTTVVKDQEFEKMWNTIAPSVVTLGVEKPVVEEARMEVIGIQHYILLLNVLFNY